MSAARPLGRNEWWCVRSVRSGFVHPYTASATQAGAREAYLAAFRPDVEHLQSWRSHRDGAHGLERVEVVRVCMVMTGRPGAATR